MIVKAVQGHYLLDKTVDLWPSVYAEWQKNIKNTYEILQKFDETASSDVYEFTFTLRF